MHDHFEHFEHYKVLLKHDANAYNKLKRLKRARVVFLVLVEQLVLVVYQMSEAKHCKKSAKFTQTEVAAVWQFLQIISSF